MDCPRCGESIPESSRPILRCPACDRPLRATAAIAREALPAASPGRTGTSRKEATRRKGTSSARKEGTSSARKEGTNTARRAGTSAARREGTRSARKEGTRQISKRGLERQILYMAAGVVALLVLVVVVLVFALSGPEKGKEPEPIAAAPDPARDASADDPGEAVLNPPDAPAGPPKTTGPKIDRFFERLGRRFEGVAEESGVLVWRDGDCRFEIAGSSQGSPIFETACGRVEIDAALLDAGLAGIGDPLDRLVRKASEAGLGAKRGESSGFSLARDLLFGVYLVSDRHMVLEDGVVEQEVVEDAYWEKDLANLRSATERFRQEIGASSLTELSKTALLDVVARLHARDDEREYATSEVLPSFARKLVRSGWLTSLGDLAQLDAARALESAVREVTRLKPVQSHKGSGLALSLSRDALGNRSWRVATPSRNGYAASPSLPRYHPQAAKKLAEAGRLLVRLSPGVDPTADPALADHVIQIELYHGSVRVLSWSPEGGLVADLEAWRQVAPRPSAADLVTDFLPPHLVVTDLSGDVRMLVTAHGRVVPPRDPSPEEAERFLDEAAKALPDPAHLDLVGEHFFNYVFDSPDTAVPQLVGNESVHGEIHQTAHQSLASAVGGVCRGDCDDLSELYVDIATRQGRLAHVVSLPAHAAAAFVQEDGAGWRAYVLQTGPAYEFPGKTAEESLGALYEHFDAGGLFDPAGLGVLLRFPGENTRSAWGLGARIFVDREYAETMIDVQKDWHYGTYSQGIAKMKAEIEKGDRQISNYKELAGLYRSTTEWDLAIENEKEALAQSADDESRFQRSMDMVFLYGRAKKTAEARALGESLSQEFASRFESLPPLVGMRLGMELAGKLVEADLHDLAWRLLSRDLHPKVVVLFRALAARIEGGGLDPRAIADPSIRYAFEGFVRTALAVLARMPNSGSENSEDAGDAPDRGPVLDTIEMYLALFVPLTIEGPSDIADLYSLAADYHGAVLGEEDLEERVAAAALPTGAVDHANRDRGTDRGEAQLERDLPWIRASVGYWSKRLGHEFRDEATALDRARIEFLLARVEEAAAAAARLGIASFRDEEEILIARLSAGLALDDDPAVRKTLARVRAKNDRRLRQNTAERIGNAARFLSADALGRALAAWKDELDDKPKYLAIAWEALRRGAPAAAVLAARAAAERYPDDPTFQREFEYLKSIAGR